MATITFVDRLTTIDCARCGIQFAMPEGFERRRREDHEAFFCPSGHSNYFNGESEAENLKKQLAKKEAEVTAAQNRAKSYEAWLDDERASHRSTVRQLNARKGVITRMKRRTTKGMCPCCSKKFKDLAIHLREQHPDWDPDKHAEALEAKGT